MANVPDHPKIFHITHVANLAQIARAGFIWSDRTRNSLGINCHVIGMSKIKQRRLEELEVNCHPGTMVGDYVPFYFCPRSVMLYILYMGNNPDLDYRGGQGPIIHLVADLHAAVASADSQNQRWAFCSQNAGTRYVGFWNSLATLDQVDWAAVQTDDFRDPSVKQGKQAEFLLHDSFPWHLVEAIGVLNSAAADQVRAGIEGVAHHPAIRIERHWYF